MIARSDMWRRFGRNERGAAAVELALIGPFLIAMIFAIIVYGGWFWLAQGVQSLASEAARASLGGLDVAEQRTIAQALVRTQAADVAAIDPDATTVSVTNDGQVIRVSVTYDAQGHPLMTLAGVLAPSPPLVISRTAAIRTGGY